MGNKRFPLWVFILIMTFSSCVVNAQENTFVDINPIKQTSPIKWKTDIYIYGLGGSIKNGTLWTATNGNLTTISDYDIYNTFVDIGLTANFYRNNLFRYSASAGYMYNRYAINRGINTDGLLSNWIFLDFSAGVQLGYGLFINAGLKGNFFISGNNKPSADFQYLGLNNDCYNKFSNNWYIGASYDIKFIKLEFKFGSYITPILNANKIAYYNLGETHVEGLFFEVGLGFKVFSTANKYNSLIDY